MRATSYRSWRDEMLWLCQRARFAWRSLTGPEQRRPWELARLDHPTLDVRLKVDSRAELHRLRSCGKEPWTVTWIEQSFRPGDVLYDVGANIGAYSILAARATRGQASVVAFEPSPATFAALAENVRLNRVSGSVTTLPVALARRSGLLALCMSDPAPGAASHRLAPVAPGAEAGGAVLALQLDEAVERFGLPAPTLLKLDVDGGELSVIEGARRTLRGGNVRSLLIELERERAGDLVAHLDELGFGLAERHRRPSADVSVPDYGIFRRR